jgi:hypothetical protein
MLTNVKLKLYVMQMLLAQTWKGHTTVSVKQVLVEMASFVKVNVLRMSLKLCATSKLFEKFASII